MRWLAIAAVVAACKSNHAAPKPAEASAAASGSGGGGPVITLPDVRGEAMPADAAVLAITASGLRRLGDGAAPAVDTGGRLAIPDGPLISTAQLDAELPRDAIVVIAADRGALVDGVIAPIVGAIGTRCWALAVATGGATAALTIECPRSEREPGQAPPDFAMVIGHGAIWLCHSRTDGMFAMDSTNALEAQLHDFKQTPFFIDRDDVGFGVKRDTTVGDVAAAAAAAHRAGFTRTYWLPYDQLAGALQAAAAGSGGSGGSGSAAVTPDAGSALPRGSGSGSAPPGATAKIAMSPITGDLGGLAQDDVDRVIKARAGVLRACYQKEVAHQPDLAGDLATTIVVGADGRVGEVRTSGTLASTAVATCAAAQLRRMLFPAKGPATITVTLTYGH